MDGLSGFREAIAAAYPQAQIQRCIIHQICSSTRYVSWKDIKALMADLKKVYQSVTKEEAISKPMAFKEAWGKQYHPALKVWTNLYLGILLLHKIFWRACISSTQ